MAYSLRPLTTQKEQNFACFCLMFSATTYWALYRYAQIHLAAQPSEDFLSPTSMSTLWAAQTLQASAE